MCVCWFTCFGSVDPSRIKLVLANRTVRRALTALMQHSVMRLIPTNVSSPQHIQRKHVLTQLSQGVVASATRLVRMARFHSCAMLPGVGQSLPTMPLPQSMRLLVHGFLHLSLSMEPPKVVIAKKVWEIRR